MPIQTGPDTARPTFYKEAVQNNAKSAEQGRPIFDEKEFVRIDIPGDRNMNWIGEVEDGHRARFPAQYAAFKRGEARAATGTPLEVWANPLMTASKVAELKAINILSVEELAGLQDSALPKLGMGARDLREQARVYIGLAKEGAGSAKMATEMAHLKAELEQLRSMLGGGREIPADVQAEPDEGTPLENWTDAQLKMLIKRNTGNAPRGVPTTVTLIRMARESMATDASAENAA